MVSKGDSDWFHLAQTLVVDPEPIMRDVLAEILQDAGYGVSKAATFDEGLLVAESVQPEIIFLDMRLPESGSIRFIRAALNLVAKTCILAVTDSPSVEDAVEAIREGAYDYLRKPYNVTAVERCVDRAVERCRLRREVEEKERYRQLSITDGLTGLFNHRHFHELLAHEVARAQRYERQVSLVLLDVDDFKVFNDTMGHCAGDRMLRHLSRILRSGARNVDHVARHGGEEFALILPETRKEGAWALARSLCDMVFKASFEGESCLPLGSASISAGVATFPEDGVEPTALVSRADRAMYGAKAKGKNCVVVFKDGDMCTAFGKDPEKAGPQPSPLLS